MFPIRYDDKQQLGKGDFGAKVENGELVLPPEMQPLVKQLLGSFASAQTFLGMLENFPTTYAMHCGWTQAETQQAKETLKSQLRGHIPDNEIDFDPPHVSYGFNGGPCRPPENK